MIGDKIAEITEQVTASQSAVIAWDCADIAPGIYLVRAKVNGKVLRIRKIALID